MFADRVIVVDREVSDLAGQLSARAQLLGHDPGVSDALIAATAQSRDLTVLTRNIRHFTSFGVACLDPFSERPA